MACEIQYLVDLVCHLPFRGLRDVLEKKANTHSFDTKSLVQLKYIGRMVRCSRQNFNNGHYVRLRKFLCACSKRRERSVERTLRRQQLYLSKFIVCSVFLLDVIILEVGYGIRVVHSPAQRRQHNRMWNQTSTGRNGGYMTDLHERPFRRSKVLTRDEIVL